MVEAAVLIRDLQRFAAAEVLLQAAVAVPPGALGGAWVLCPVGCGHRGGRAVTGEAVESFRRVWLRFSVLRPEPFSVQLALNVSKCNANRERHSEEINDNPAVMAGASGSVPHFFQGVLGRKK